MPGRLLMAPDQLQRVAKIVMRLGVAGPQRQRLPIVLDCFVYALEPGQNDAEMLLRIGRSLVELTGAAKQRFGLGELGVLQANEAQPINRVEMAGIGGEHAVVEIFCLAELSLRVQYGRTLKGLRGVETPPLHQRRCAQAPAPFFLRLPLFSNMARAWNCGFFTAGR